LDSEEYYIKFKTLRKEENVFVQRIIHGVLLGKEQEVLLSHTYLIIRPGFPQLSFDSQYPKHFSKTTIVLTFLNQLLISDTVATSCNYSDMYLIIFTKAWVKEADIHVNT
jgi:hypothetical protein